MIVNSPDISILDFKVLVDISTVTPTIKFINLSTGANLAGVKWLFHAYTPNNTPIHISSFASPDVTGAWTDFTLPENIPQLLNNIIWSGSEYRFVVTVQDSAGTEFSMEIKKDICRPNGNENGSNYGKGLLDIEVRCNDARLFVVDKTNYAYKKQVQPTLIIQKKLTLVYPPTEQGTYPAPYVINNFSNGLIPISYSGPGYQAILESIVQYDLGDGVTIQVKYKLIESFAVQCNVDLCGLLCEYRDMVKKAEDNCDKEYASKLLLINAKINQAIMGKIQPLCKVDVGKLVEEIKVLGGFSCDCNCGNGIVALGSGSESALNCNDVIACLNTLYNNLDPHCLATQLEWEAMSLTGKQQLILNSLQTLLCDIVNPADRYCADFQTNVEQNNEAPVNSYNFMGLFRDNNICIPLNIAPPTGFAVTGNTRVSAFGKMEWFANLTLANADAAAGETVLIFNDTIENLVIKDNVNYQGIGQHRIGNLATSGTNPSVNHISNLTVQELSVANGNITAYNVDILKVSTIGGNCIWIGGNFVNDPTAVGPDISIIGNASVSRIYSSKLISMTGTSKLSFSTIEDSTSANPSYPTIILQGLDAGNIPCVIDNCYISSVNNVGLYSLYNQIVTNNTIRTGLRTALYCHGGGIGSTYRIVCSNNTCYNIGATHVIPFVEDAAIELFYIGELTPVPGSTTSNYVFSNNTGFSVNGSGIQSLISSMRGCHGYSINGAGILIDSAATQGRNIAIMDCTGESANYFGLQAERDIYITGGTYKSRGVGANGSPIRLKANSQNGFPDIKYKVIGVTTIKTDPTALNISSGGSQLNYGGTFPKVIIAGCKFLSENEDNVPLNKTIDPALAPSLLPVSVDAWGNIF